MSRPTSISAYTGSDQQRHCNSGVTLSLSCHALKAVRLCKHSEADCEQLKRNAARVSAPCPDSSTICLSSLCSRTMKTERGKQRCAVLEHTALWSPLKASRIFPSTQRLLRLVADGQARSLVVTESLRTALDLHSAGLLHRPIRISSCLTGSRTQRRQLLRSIAFRRLPDVLAYRMRCSSSLYHLHFTQ